MPVTNKLTIHQSDQLDYLCELLLGFYRLRSHPFETFTLVVQTEGMKQFISQYFSHRLGIVSNLNYQKISHFFWKTAQAFYPGLKQETDLYQQKIISWQLFNLFSSQDFKKHAPLAYQALYSYLKSHESSAYELALYLGKLFEEYLIYRPQWIEIWDKNQQVRELPEKIEQWQRNLWYYLRRTFGENHRIYLWQKIKKKLLKNKLPSEVTLPKHIHFFAIDHFPNFYLKLANYLSLHTYVHLFCLNPCQENWIDDNDTHPLLNMLGGERRDFFKILSEYNPSLEQKIFSDRQLKNSDILLHKIQQDILYLELPKFYQKQVSFIYKTTDQSIQIHAAHSKVQELYILKNNLLRYLDEHKNTRLEEVVILSPDIEKYLPYIEGIFGKNNFDNYAIPYSILNVKVKNQSIFYEAIDNFIVFLSGRFEVDSLLSLLKNKLIRSKANLSSDDIFCLAKIIEKANISWGIDEQHRKKFHAIGDAFTWERGLKNINHVLKKENVKIIHPSIFDISTFNDKVDGEYLIELWKNFLDFYQEIVAYYRKINNKNLYFTDWIISLQELVNVFISHNSIEISEQKEQLFSNLFRIKQNIELTTDKSLLSFSLFARIIKQYLNEYTSNNSLKKGVVFSNLISMRSIPFKFTAILGLNEQDFPRQDKQQEFNLIKADPQIGDLSRYQDDCYIFLQTLLSTKDVLHLSYIGRDSTNKKALNPSFLLDQLINLIKEMTQEKYVNYIKEHPLHPFSRQYFEINSLFDHYGSNYHCAYKSSNLSFNDFLYDYSFSPIIKKELNIQELLSFWHSPTRYWLLENLDIFEQRLKKVVNYDEPFSLIPNYLSRKTKRKILIPKGIFILQKLLESTSNSQSQEELNSLIDRWDYFPAGAAKKIWYDYIFYQFNKLINFIPSDSKISIKELLINKKQNDFLLKSDYLFLKVDHLLSYGTEENYLFDFDFKHYNISDREKIKILLLHLIYQKNYKGSSIKSYLFTLNEGIEINIAENKAEELFNRFIFFTERGLIEPLPFFYDPLMKFSTKNNLLSEGNIKKILDSTELNFYENRLLFHSSESLIKNRLLKELINELIKPLLQENIFKEIIL